MYTNAPMPDNAMSNPAHAKRGTTCQSNSDIPNAHDAEDLLTLLQTYEPADQASRSQQAAVAGCDSTSRQAPTTPASTAPPTSSQNAASLTENAKSLATLAKSQSDDPLIHAMADIILALAERLDGLQGSSQPFGSTPVSSVPQPSAPNPTGGHNHSANNGHTGHSGGYGSGNANGINPGSQHSGDHGSDHGGNHGTYGHAGHSDHSGTSQMKLIAEVNNLIEPHLSGGTIFDRYEQALSRSDTQGELNRELKGLGKEVRQAMNDAYLAETDPDKKEHMLNVFTDYLMSNTHNNEMADDNRHTHEYDTNDAISRKKDLQPALEILEGTQAWENYLADPTNMANIQALETTGGKAYQKAVDTVLGVGGYALGHLHQSEKNSEFRTLFGLNKNGKNITHEDMMGQFDEAKSVIKEQLENNSLNDYMGKTNRNAAGNARQNYTTADGQVMSVLSGYMSTDQVLTGNGKERIREFT